MNRTKIKIFGTSVLAAAAVAAGYFVWRGRDKPPPPPAMVFDGDSRPLKSTRVLATLDDPIEDGMNAVWCASFLAAWKTMEADLAGGPVSLKGSPETFLALNMAADPRPDIPTDCLYAAAGWNRDGIIEKIAIDMAGKFPTKAKPDFPNITPESFIAYAYLEANVKFALPYVQSPFPFVFVDDSRRISELSSFGFKSTDVTAFPGLAGQPSVLFASRTGDGLLKEYIVDLDRTSNPNQVILSVIEPKLTLAEMLADGDRKIAAWENRDDAEEPRPIDSLRVPDMFWRIRHRFEEIEGREFTNAKLMGQRIDIARQDIEFRLNRQGAELKAEAKFYEANISNDYVFNRPFLLITKKRGAKTPYFVMWIANAELLCKWGSAAQ